jgi:hypothetical protein
MGGASTKSRTELLVDTPFFFRFRVFVAEVLLRPRFNMVEGERGIPYVTRAFGFV